MVKDLIDRYYGHDVARDGAALTYYLLFAIFPLLVFISTLVGLMELDVESVMLSMSRILPEQVVGIIGRSMCPPAPAGSCWCSA